MSNTVSTPAVPSSSERFIGRVKWFNNKAGYGFITVTDGPKSGTDVFVHHSSIKVESEQYKYLVQGEYIDFLLSDTKTSNHEFQAGDVCGIKGGKLMCETIHDSRIARFQHRVTNQEQQTMMPRSVSVPMNSSSRPPRTRGQGPREGQGQGEWSYVGNSREQSSSSRGRPPRHNSNRTGSQSAV